MFEKTARSLAGCLKDRDRGIGCRLTVISPDPSQNDAREDAAFALRG